MLKSTGSSALGLVEDMERHHTVEAIKRRALEVGLPVALHANAPGNPIDRYYIHSMSAVDPQVLRALEASDGVGVLVLPYPNTHRESPDP